MTGAAKRIGRAIALAAVSSRLSRRDSLRRDRRRKRARRPKNADRRRCSKPISKKSTISSACFGEVEERLGSLYGLVNNAARFRRVDPLQLTEADWDFIHNVNLKATFFCCQQAALLMKKTGAGRIVNISSLGGIRPVGYVRALLRFEGRRDHADARAGESVCAGNHGELGGAGSDSGFEAKIRARRI